MLSFEFGQDLDQFREAIRQFARKELLPGYRARAAKDEFPWPEHKALASLGVLGIGLPAEFGGTGTPDFLALGIACEEIGYADVSLASGPIQSGLIGAMIAEWGTEAARRTYLPGLISGDEMVAIALTEPAAGSDASALTCTAVDNGDGWILNGEKTSISHVRPSRATIVFARSPGTRRSEGISAFIVEHDQPGVSIGSFNDMGLLPIGRGSLALTDAFVPRANLLGDVGQGFRLVMKNFDFSRPAIGLQCVGAAQASLDEAAAYLTQRHTFGKPLAAYQGLSLPMAEHYTLIEAARWLCYRTLWLRQTGQPHTAEAAMCKWWAPRVARDCIETALLIHGHPAWSDEFPLQQRFRDVMAFFLADGSAEIQKLIVSRDRIGREVMGG